MAALSRQLETLTLEREECEDLLANILGFKQKRVRTGSAGNAGGSPLERLLQAVTREQERIIGLVERLERISGARQTEALHSSLAKWKVVTRDIYSTIKVNNSKDNLAVLLPNLVTSIRRVRTLLWTIVNLGLSS